MKIEKHAEVRQNLLKKLLFDGTRLNANDFTVFMQDYINDSDYTITNRTFYRDIEQIENEWKIKLDYDASEKKFFLTKESPDCLNDTAKQYISDYKQDISEQQVEEFFYERPSELYCAKLMGPVAENRDYAEQSDQKKAYVADADIKCNATICFAKDAILEAKVFFNRLPNCGWSNSHKDDKLMTINEVSEALIIKLIFEFQGKATLVSPPALQKKIAAIAREIVASHQVE